jgi:hypothetical protein
LDEQIRGAGDDLDALRDLEDFLLLYEDHPCVATARREVSSKILFLALEEE